jgi:hypothetical protein
MPPRDIHHAHAGLKALSHNPGLCRIRPAPISTCSRHNLDAASKTAPPSAIAISF